VALNLLADGGDSALSAGSLVLAAITAALGFASAYLLDFLSSRRAPKKALSWDLTTETPTVTYGATNATQLKMTYNGSPVERLVTVIHRVSNTGTERIENEFLRYEVPLGARILERRLEPTPPPEMAVEDLTDSDPNFPGIRYKIGAIDPGQTLGVVLVADGGEWDGWKGPIDHNADSYVSFTRRELSQELGEEAHIARFLSSFAVFAILALLGGMLFVEFWVLSRFPLKTWAYYVYAIAVSAMLVGLAANLILRANRATRAVARAIQRAPKTPLQFHVYGEGQAVYSESGIVNLPQRAGSSESES
jgi:hypothetical protein